HDITLLKSIRLDANEKDRMRAALSAYADMHTVPARMKARSRSPLFAFNLRAAYTGAFALLLIIATGAQATFASERALPGDVLYPVKVGVSEPLALALAGSAERKADLAAAFATRRIDE